MSQEYRIVIQRKQTTGEYDEGETLHLGEYQHPTTLLQLEAVRKGGSSL